MYGGNFKLQNYPITKLPNLFFDPALVRVGILSGARPAYRGRKHADLLGHLLDHHRFQVIDTSFQKILLADNDRVADLGDGLLPLLNILDELDGARVALFAVIALVLV